MDFQERLKEVKSLYQQDKISMAYKKMCELEEMEREEELIELLKEQETIELFEKIKKEKEEVDELLQYFNNTDGWTITHEVNGVKTYYRHEENNPIHSLRLEGIVNAPLFNILSIIYEIDLYTNWWPLLKESTQLKQISKYRKIVYMRCELPFPLHHRDVCLYGYGVDLLEEDVVVITVRSSQERDSAEDWREPAIPNRYVRIDCKIGGIYLTPISPTETKVIMICNADPKLYFVPYWLLNLVTKNLAHKLFQMFREEAMNVPNSEYEKRISENPEVYGEVKHRLEKYFEKVE